MDYSDPHATHFHNPINEFGPEWKTRMTLMKVDGRSGGQWRQMENAAKYCEIQVPFRKLVPGEQSCKTLTFVSPQRTRDYYVVTSEVPISQYPLLDGEIASWPEDAEGKVVEGGQIPLLAA